MNKYLNDNWRSKIEHFRPEGFKSIGLLLHNIFSHAATTVPYKDLFNDTE
jgi:hypothetical protein